MPDVSDDSNDPNLNQNRTPTPRELLTLYGLMSQNARMSANMTLELSTAKQVLDQIKRREEEMLLEMESVQSERHAAMRFVELLEGQYKALETEQQQLAGLTHPIRRYPSDILRIVFKWTTVLGNKRWCKETTNISQNILIPEFYEEPCITAFWEQVKPNLRSATPNITFILWKRDEHDDTTDEEELALPLMVRASGLGSFEHIGCLQFLLPASSTTQLMNLRVYHKNRIDRLEVGINNSTTIPHSWDCSQLLQYFPNAAQMQIMSLPVMIASGTQIFGSITAITLTQVRSSSLVANLARFPNLETLSLSEVDFESDDPNPEIVLPALKVFSIDSFEKLPWTHVHTPQLHSFLAFALDTLNEGVVEFISRNQSLRHVIILPSESPLPDQFKSFAHAAPNIEILELSHYSPALYDWETVGLTAPPFPNLREFVYVVEKELYVDVLEKVIASCCDICPVDRTKSPPARTLEKLSVRFGIDQVKELNWKQLSSPTGYNLAYHQAPESWAECWVDWVFSRDGGFPKS